MFHRVYGLENNFGPSAVVFGTMNCSKLVAAMATVGDLSEDTQQKIAKELRVNLDEDIESEILELLCSLFAIKFQEATFILIENGELKREIAFTGPEGRRL